MDVYVQSRTKNTDYYWVSKSTTPTRVHNVPSIIESVNKFNGDKDLKLVHETDASIVLLRSSSELLLLVSGLRTKRQDKDRRYIRNSIAWLGKEADEPILRQIAAFVLENNLRILENLVVESSNNSDKFEVNWQDIEQLISRDTKARSNPLQEDREIGKIAFFSEQPMQELANELIEYELPKRDGALLVVTKGNKPKAIFVRANVWRGLSNSISTWQNLDSNSKDYQSIIDELSQLATHISDVTQNPTENFQNIMSKLSKLSKFIQKSE